MKAELTYSSFEEGCSIVIGFIPEEPGKHNLDVHKGVCPIGNKCGVDFNISDIALPEDLPGPQSKGRGTRSKSLGKNQPFWGVSKALHYQAENLEFFFEEENICMMVSSDRFANRCKRLNVSRLNTLQDIHVYFLDKKCYIRYHFWNAI